MSDIVSPLLSVITPVCPMYISRSLPFHAASSSSLSSAKGSSVQPIYESGVCTSSQPSRLLSILTGVPISACVAISAACEGLVLILHTLTDVRAHGFSTTTGSGNRVMLSAKVTPDSSSISMTALLASGRFVSPLTVRLPPSETTRVTSQIDSARCGTISAAIASSFSVNSAGTSFFWQPAN